MATPSPHRTGRDPLALIDDVLSNQYALRDRLAAAVRRDLVGPEHADEVLSDDPFNTYIAGVLYPGDPRSVEQDQATDTDDDDSEGSYADPPVALSNTRYPSSMGLSFAIEEGECASLTVRIEAARYAPSGNGWARQPVESQPVPVDLRVNEARDVRLMVDEHLKLFVRLRKATDDGRRAVTAVLINTAAAAPGQRDALSYFQVQMKVDSPGGAVFVDRGHTVGGGDANMRTHALLYRHRHTFAVGHGTSASWVLTPGGERATEIATTTLPEHKVPVVDSNPEINASGLAMSRLAYDAREEVVATLRSLTEEYAEWITRQRDEAQTLDEAALRTTADEHLASCLTANARIRAGIDALELDDESWTAFRLMNEAMLQQRARSAWIAAGRPDGGPQLDDQHRWRPFQIAFILLNLTGVTDSASSDRDIVDLLWFPTGGGKTEAYLGLIAYVVLLRRLRHGDDGAGVAVLMRYTLRLLTIQQFERAASLICALEVIRRGNSGELGNVPITIGLWVGRDGTPGTVPEARKAINDLRANRPVAKGNPMQVHHCPWCGTPLTARDYWIGDRPSRLNINCGDALCEFAKGLPVYVVDDDIFAVRPALVIATADKFAALPWMKEGGYRLFIDPHGKHGPPELIVQDELHLISGPLGTLAGLYEAAVDLLCESAGIRPKVIASTATIRRASDQVQALFDRGMAQFPPPGLNAGDSFFATQASPEEKADRLYLGALAPGTSQSTLMIRVYAALMQAVADDLSSDEVRDPFWTLVGYFNSLRVLGSARIQVSDDVQDRLGVIAKGAPRAAVRRIELTSREQSSDIPAHLANLSRGLPDVEALDYVLATNMISVGVDVDRLGLMVVMGQPQATAEYIQATSRVGRRHPGLVVTLFNASRSRDRSHYERFVTYHDALYQQVEATSVTPFSPRARDRALHAVLILLARVRIPDMRANDGAGAIAAHRTEIDTWVERLAERARRMPAGAGDPDDLAESVRAEAKRVLDDWTARAAGGLRYVDPRPDVAALMASADAVQGDRLPTPSSLRDVDSECTLYLI